MAEDRIEAGEVAGRALRIAYLHPAEPTGQEAVAAAIVTLGGQEYPLTVRAEAGDADARWRVAFGDLADEGRYPTFAAALAAAHERAPRDAADLARALRDGGY